MFLLFVLFSFHWFLILFISFYSFIRKTSVLDWFYFALVTIIILGWFINKNECIVSFFEKTLLNCDYVAGSDPANNPSLALYNDNGNQILYWSLIPFILITFIRMLSFRIPDKKITIFTLTIALYSIFIFYHFVHGMKMT